MVASGMMMKNGKTAKWERIFDSYDSKGREIKPDVAADVLRIVKGFEYLDNLGSRKIAHDETVYNRQHAVRLPNDAYVRANNVYVNCTI